MKKEHNNPIRTKHVYSEKNSNKVYLKKDDEQWFPINFQWIPVLKLNNEINKKSNIMKTNLLLPILLLAILISSCTKDDDYIGSGSTITETRDVSSFTKVKSEGTFIVNIYQGTEQSVEVTADDNIMNKVRTTVSNNELKLYLSDGNYTDVTLEVNITVPNLNGLKNSGIGDITVFDVSYTDNFNIDNSGSGDITIKGQVSELDIRNEGSGIIYADQLISTNCKIKILGSGNCEVFCTNNLDVDIEGSGNVYFKGNPSINTNISGSGSVIDSN